MAVKEELKKLGLHFILVELGEVDIMEDITAEQHNQIASALSQYGLELMGDKKNMLIEKIKNAVIEMVHYTGDPPKLKFSDYLEQKLGQDYHYMSNLFSEVQGTTIEHFIIAHKIERAKELLIYDELTLTQISYKLNYSSVAHLSNQFKKVTGLTANITSGYADKRQYFVDTLSFAVSQVAAAFYPKDVIVRMSDFKTNEYAALTGGKFFEPEEENPMLGFRGASRYYNDRYREGFRLECEAMKRVREKMGLSNVKLMIPFCRTVDEGEKVVRLMDEFGLKRGERGLEIYVMCEIPSNVILAEQFAKIFDGFSIGSNDLTQLTLGIDRDSDIVNNLFDERNEAPKWMIATAIRKAKEAHVKIGLCGQAPSDYPEFAQFLVEQKIDSISFNPDALIKGIENIHAAEKKSANNQFLKN